MGGQTGRQNVDSEIPHMYFLLHLTKVHCYYGSIIVAFWIKHIVKCVCEACKISEAVHFIVIPTIKYYDKKCFL